MSEPTPVEITIIEQDWLTAGPWRWLTIEISVMGNRQQASICGRCAAVVFDVHKSIHDEFHNRSPFDPPARMDGSPPPDMPPATECS